eukprot:4641928-Amphidinium_carterae.1
MYQSWIVLGTNCTILDEKLFPSDQVLWHCGCPSLSRAFEQEKLDGEPLEDTHQAFLTVIFLVDFYGLSVVLDVLFH